MSKTSTARKNLTITIEYARNKLGEKGKKMTDQQIADLLSTLRFLCNKSIDSALDKKVPYQL